MHYFFESDVWNNGAREVFSALNSDQFSYSMVSLGQNVEENPRHVSWNNKNTEFEEGRQNVMGFWCMYAVYESTRYLHSHWQQKNVTVVPDIQVYHSKKIQQARENKYHKEIT